MVAEIPGSTDEWIVLTAHYDSTSLSHGAYDNMTGCIGLLGIMDELSASAPNRYGLRFVFCGSEERGLLGSKAYVAAHKEELDKVVLNVNLDMIGSIMGKFIAVASAEEKLVNYLSYISMEIGWGIEGRQGVYSSDSTPFADAGVPAVSFARIAGGTTAPIHNRYDTKAVVSAPQCKDDIDFLAYFCDRMANSVVCPVSREIPEKVKEDLDYYLNRKRRPANR
ncbi:MAG: Zn-dependent exopeptidase M28 [Lachnospiraceae bacterium]|nr:Zn-dependent exopeptidase M28 [Lachnospiraceae bacterium]